MATKRVVRLKKPVLKILLLDVETSPNIAYVWGKFEQDVLGEFVRKRHIISFAWKWLGEKQVHVLALPDFPGYKKNPEDNTKLVLRLYSLMGEADVVVAHNLDEFDDKMANTDFIVHGLPPPPPHKAVDTLKFARHKFRFNSNKLDDLGAELHVGRKVRHWGFELWVRCLHGDPAAWALMKKYNRGDVELLERVYLKLRPWMTNHPNMNAPDRHVGCPVCRSVKIQKRGWRINKWGKTPRFQCQECGKWINGALVKGEWRFQ